MSELDSNKLNKENPTQKYSTSFGLTLEDKEKIISIIKSNFESKPDFDLSKLTDDWLKKELNIVIKHVRIKHSHHMDSLYTNENYYKIKRIVSKKT